MQELILARFGGIARLYGQKALARFGVARVAVVGLGGVGSWAVEALARSGFGNLTLIDLDDICVTNINRQIQALGSTVGLSKSTVLAERIAEINPHCKVSARQQFYTEANSAEIFGADGMGFDLVVDAIDSINPKCHLILSCLERKIPMIVCGGAGGKTDVSKIQVADLSETHGDALLSSVRRNLREQKVLARGEEKIAKKSKPQKSGICCVFSPQQPVFPTCNGETGTTRDPGFRGRMACEAGFGASTHVTGTFGFFAASLAIDFFAKEAEKLPD